MSPRTIVTGVVTCLVAALAGGFIVAGLAAQPGPSNAPTGSTGVSSTAPYATPPSLPRGNSLHPPVSTTAPSVTKTETQETYVPIYPTLPCTWLDGQCVPTMGGKG